MALSVSGFAYYYSTDSIAKLFTFVHKKEMLAEPLGRGIRRTCQSDGILYIINLKENTIFLSQQLYKSQTLVKVTKTNNPIFLRVINLKKTFIEKC